MRLFRRRRGSPPLGHQLGHGEGESFEPLTGLGGHSEDRQPTSHQIGFDHLGELSTIGHIDLVQRHHARPVLQPAMRAEFGLDDVQVGERVASGFVGGAVDHVSDRLAALDVTQEVVPQTAALAGALDQSGNIGDGEGDRTGHHHPRFGIRVVKG